MRLSRIFQGNKEEIQCTYHAGLFVRLHRNPGGKLTAVKGRRAAGPKSRGSLADAPLYVETKTALPRLTARASHSSTSADAPLGGRVSAGFINSDTQLCYSTFPCLFLPELFYTNLSRKFDAGWRN